MSTLHSTCVWEGCHVLLIYRMELERHECVGSYADNLVMLHNMHTHYILQYSGLFHIPSQVAITQLATVMAAYEGKAPRPHPSSHPRQLNTTNLLHSE